MEKTVSPLESAPKRLKNDEKFSSPKLSPKNSKSKKKEVVKYGPMDRFLGMYNLINIQKIDYPNEALLHEIV